MHVSPETIYRRLFVQSRGDLRHELLRQYLPRHVSMRDYSQDDLDVIAAQLNGRPRQTLGFKTPSEALNEALR